MLDDARPGGCLHLGYVDNQIEQLGSHAVAHIGVGGAALVDPIHGISVAQDWAPDWPRVVSMMWVISIGVIPVMMLRSFHRVASGLPG